MIVHFMSIHTLHNRNIESIYARTHKHTLNHTDSHTHTHTHIIYT
jgi:hypothetical protein